MWLNHEIIRLFSHVIHFILKYLFPDEDLKLSKSTEIFLNYYPTAAFLLFILPNQSRKLGRRYLGKRSTAADNK